MQVQFLKIGTRVGIKLRSIFSEQSVQKIKSSWAQTENSTFLNVTNNLVWIKGNLMLNYVWNTRQQW